MRALGFVAVCLAVAMVLPACRPVVRACSSRDLCAAGSACVGGRCELATAPAAIAESERVVLAPTRVRYVEQSGQSALLLAFDYEVPVERVLEAHLLVRQASPADGFARVFRVTAPWNERSTPSAEALGLVGPLESETRLTAEGSTLVRLHLSAGALPAQRTSGWAVRLEPSPSPAAGVALAESSETGPRLELYLRKAKGALTRPPARR